MKSKIYMFLICLSLFTINFDLIARSTRIKYLSGTGSDNTVDWQFYCTDGNNSGKWTTISVPSNWELQGFGKYNYGHAKDEERGKESGLYKYTFDVPGDWKGNQVSIVFEGSMTDTEVKINGKLAGSIHQGAFYQFKYDISKLLKYGKENLLEVKVDKHSANNSVNKAERYADFWIFGGIFRPVYLEAKPVQNIKRVAIDARAEGDFIAEVFLENIKLADQVKAQVLTLKGDLVGESFSTDINNGTDKVLLQNKLWNIKTWNPEYPNLYRVKLELLQSGRIIHEYTERFGFRTIDVRKRDGIYVNGVKIKIKGVNRHTFWPTTGRASCKSRSVEDVNLIKSMNMNAVRMSHYPPDSHFLDVCDSLGLFVLDELTGWHDAYDTEVGSKLVKEMVTRDVNHPSIILWDNGNEGGHNPDLDPLFAEYDIQKREVIYPWRTFNGFSTEHYRSYDYGAGTYWHGHNITLPTEFLHGMYDGGHGAGLYDYWELMWNTSVAAGGFLWDLADEGVVRTDQDGAIDTYGSSAADGIVGPFHEKEGSYFAVKEIWSPVKFEDRNITSKFDGKLYLENRYLYTNLKECTFKWRLAKMQLPVTGSVKNDITGMAKSPNVQPGQKGFLKLDLPTGWFTYDVLYVSAFDQYNNELYTWSWPISLPQDIVSQITKNENTSQKVTYNDIDSLMVVNAGSVQFSVGKNDGILRKVVNDKGEIPFVNGPLLCAGEAIFDSLNYNMVGDTLFATCTFDKKSRMKEFTWAFYPSGWVKLDIYYVPEKYDINFDYMGVSFSYPEELVEGVKWLGNGPYRVWKNRMQGVEQGVYQKDYNTTKTGVPPFVYPEFKGYHSNLYWANIESKGQSFTVATSSEDVFLRLYTPDQPEKAYERVAPPVPGGDISFLQAIPAIGTKSNDSFNMGPSGKQNMFFDYGPYDNWRSRCKRMVLYFDFSSKQ